MPSAQEHLYSKIHANLQVEPIRIQLGIWFYINMNWASLPQAEGLFATERMKPVVNENIEAEMLKLAISNKFPGRMELALAHQAANKFGITKHLDT